MAIVGGQLVEVVVCLPLSSGRGPVGLLLLLLLLFELLFQVHLHVALLLVAPGELPTAGVTAEGLLACVSPLVGGQVVAAAEGARALLLVGPL